MFKDSSSIVCLVLLSMLVTGFVSAAEVRYVNGCKVEGDYKDGKKNGTWSYYNACGKKVRQETFRDGVLHGKNCRWDDDGLLLSEENWQAGKRHGKSVAYWITGSLRSEGTFHEGNGKLTGYFPSGKKQFEEEFANDNPFGRQLYWNENDQKMSEYSINEAGQYNGSYKFYPYELEYKNGMILKIIESVIIDGKTSEKIWEPAYYKDGKLGGFSPKGVEEGVGYISLGLDFYYDSIHKQYIVRSSDNVTGGPCEYLEIPGTAKITAIKPAGAGYNCPRNPVEVLFDFMPVDPKLSCRNAQDRHFQIGAGMNPSMDFVEKRGLKVGQTLRCIRKEIVRGTCSPLGFDFPDVDLSDYGKFCF